MKRIWHDIDTLCFASVSIYLQNVHEILSLFALIISIIYTYLRIKKDFFDL